MTETGISSTLTKLEGPYRLGGPSPPASRLSSDSMASRKGSPCSAVLVLSSGVLVSLGWLRSGKRHPSRGGPSQATSTAKAIRSGRTDGPSLAESDKVWLRPYGPPELIKLRSSSRATRGCHPPAGSCADAGGQCPSLFTAPVDLPVARTSRSLHQMARSGATFRRGPVPAATRGLWASRWPLGLRSQSTGH